MFLLSKVFAGNSSLANKYVNGKYNVAIKLSLSFCGSALVDAEKGTTKRRAVMRMTSCELFDASWVWFE